MRNGRRAPSNTASATKIPQVTLVFWVLKIAATTLGETGGDLLAQTMKIGYAVSTLILLGVMLATLFGQLRVRSFSPALYWTVIATTSMAGTTISDYIDRTLQWGYYKGSVVLVLLLVAILVFWRIRFGSLSISGVNRFSLEVTFWSTVLIANTLGTALGDWLSDNTGLGFGRATVVITALLGVVVLLHYRTTANKVVLFWAGFVLIQPLGATAGDFVTKSREIGGMGFPTYYASAILTAFLIVLIMRTESVSIDAAAHHRPAPRPQTPVPARSRASDGVEAFDDESDDIFVSLQLTATTAERLRDETEAMAERVRAEAAALAEQHRSLMRRAQETQQARHQLAEITQRTEEAERRFEELRVAEAAVMDRLRQAATLCETMFHTTRRTTPTDGPVAITTLPADLEPVDLREPTSAAASWTNGH